jgi:hypothetical protein
MSEHDDVERACRAVFAERMTPETFDLVLRTVHNLLAVERRSTRAFAETIDNVRDALGQKETHYLIVADDVKELVGAIALCESDGGCRAAETLKRLRERT